MHAEYVALPGSMHFTRVMLEAPDAKLEDLAAFYTTTLGARKDDDQSGVTIGRTAIAFKGSSVGRPVYHFAFLLPGDRFDAASTWAQSRLELLPDSETGEVVFDFENWDARAFYFHDPADNIVELIAHNGVGETGASGAFDPRELLGLSELGLIGKSDEIAHGLEAIGLRLWDGVLSPGQLAFFGERTKTLIVAEPGRGWLPTGRPAEAHPADLTIAGIPAAEITVGAYRIRSRPE
jgi:catechol 2,3-dioxygenase-like lactoylglutathione lyase family enzyme